MTIRCHDCAMRRSGILSLLPEDIFQKLCCTMHSNKYPKGHLLFVEGTISASVYSIRKGWVKITKSIKNGRTQIIGLRNSGHVLGLETLFMGYYSSTVELLTDAEICMTLASNFKNLLFSHNDIALAAIKALNFENDSLSNHIRNLGLKTARQKVATLLYLAVQSTNNSAESTFPPQLTRAEMGEFLGIASETVSRVLSQFQDEKIIKFDRKGIIILKPVKLNAITF